MVKARALDKRRKSVTSIRKITRTMELVSTAQYRRAMDRAVAAASYAERISRLVKDLAKAGADGGNPLFANRDSRKRAVLFILTANRGLCGGYNSGVLRQGVARYKELCRDFEEVELCVSGKRGVSYLKYHEYDISKIYTQFDHKPSYDDVLVIAEDLLKRYKIGEIDRVDVAYSKFISLSKQRSVSETFLPLESVESDFLGGEERDGGENSALDYEFLPSPQSILDEVVPRAFEVKFFKAFLDAAVSEQIARMMAMKSATDNADQMISMLTTTYNRARQSQITNEIIEVVSGASALK